MYDIYKLQFVFIHYVLWLILVTQYLACLL